MDERYSKAVQYIALVATALIYVGDSVEIYLPAVITQPVSCELNISKTQESVLALSFYITIATSVFLSIPFADYFGRRTTFLASLYTTLFFTVLCAVVPNYVTLLISRLLIGFTVGLNDMVNMVYLSEIAGSKEFYIFGITLLSTAFNIGGGWAGGLGYLLLEKIGWRYFVLLTSVPLYLFPIVAFQFMLPETKPSKEEARLLEDKTSETPDENSLIAGSSKRDMCLKIVKLGFISTFLSTYQFGVVLLIPSFVKNYNLSNDLNEDACGSIHGSQFLILTAIFGGCNLLGRLLSYVFQKIFAPDINITIFAVVSVLVLGVLNVIPSNVYAFYLGIGAVQCFAASLSNDRNILAADRQFFSREYLGLSVGISVGMSKVGSLVGNAISGILSYVVALRFFLGSSFLTLMFAVSLLNHSWFVHT